ncbi:MAG: acyltransferase family protein [Pseudomonadota bacterium]
MLLSVVSKIVERGDLHIGHRNMSTHLTTDRRYDIDALRVIAFGLLILYHCGMFYVADWGWHVKSAYTSVALQEPMRFTNQWRMSLLFVISGLAVSFVWQRYSAGQLARRRWRRVGAPLLLGMFIVVVPQPYYEALSQGAIEPGFFRFWYQYLSSAYYTGLTPDSHRFYQVTWNHLWYLPYVLTYTLLLCGAGKLAPNAISGLQARFSRLRGFWLLIIPVLPLQLWANTIFPITPDIEHDYFGAWYAHALFGTLFLYGFLIGRDDAIWQHMKQWRHLWLIVGIASYAILRAQDWWVDDNTQGLVEQLSFLSVYVNRWVWILVLLSWSFHTLNRPFPGLAYCTAAVFPWYVLHQTITVVAGFHLSRLSLGPVIEPLLLLGITIGGCAVLYEYVIRRQPLGHVWFGAPIKHAPIDADKPA